MLSDSKIEDDYFPVISTDGGRARLCGEVRGADEVARELFAVQLAGLPVLYGEWDTVFDDAGNRFDVEILSFGYPPSYIVGNGVGQVVFTGAETETIERIIRSLFANTEAIQPHYLFSPRRRDAFRGTVRFRVGWAKTNNAKAR